MLHPTDRELHSFYGNAPDTFEIACAIERHTRAIDETPDGGLRTPGRRHGGGGQQRGQQHAQGAPHPGSSRPMASRAWYSRSGRLRTIRLS